MRCYRRRALAPPDLVYHAQTIDATCPTLVTSRMFPVTLYTTVDKVYKARYSSPPENSCWENHTGAVSTGRAPRHTPQWMQCPAVPPPATIMHLATVAHVSHSVRGAWEEAGPSVQFPPPSATHMTKCHHHRFGHRRRMAKRPSLITHPQCS
jgi:hypothetical protein